MKANLKTLKMLVLASKTVEHFGGFNFRHIAGGLYSFESRHGNGVCYKKEDDRFKYAKAILT